MSAELKPLPCPFCGHVGLDFAEGSTFRWIVASCGGCGATRGETRVQTLGEGTKDEWMAVAQADAIDEWNRRATPAPGAPQEAAFPPRILALLHEVADRVGTEFRGPFEDGNGEPMQDDADAALRWIAAQQAAAAQADPWHTAVLAECMLTESCYQKDDPVATVKALIDWHVAAAVQAVGAWQEEITELTGDA